MRYYYIEHNDIENLERKERKLQVIATYAFEDLGWEVAEFDPTTFLEASLLWYLVYKLSSLFLRRPVC